MTTSGHHLNDYTISQLARDAGVSTDVIHNYERQGILSPVRRTACGYRVYDDQALERMRFIQSGKAAGIPLSDLAQFLRVMSAECQNECDDEAMRLQRLIETRKKEISHFKQFFSRFMSTLNGSNQTERLQENTHV